MSADNDMAYLQILKFMAKNMSVKDDHKNVSEEISVVNKAYKTIWTMVVSYLP